MSYLNINKNKTLVIDHFIERAMRRNPDYADGINALAAQNVAIVKGSDPALAGALLGRGAGEPLQSAFGGNAHAVLAVKNTLRNGVRYFEFGGCLDAYLGELQLVMRDLAGWMGAREFVWDSAHDYSDNFAANESAKGEFSVGASARGVSGSAGASAYANAQQRHASKGSGSINHAEKIICAALSPAQLREKIAREGIVLGALEPSFARQVERYLDGEAVSDTRHEIDLSSDAESYVKFAAGMSANAELVGFFSASLGIDLDFDAMQKQTRHVKIFYEMKF